MRNYRILLSILAVTTVMSLFWHSRSNADPFDQYRPPLLIKSERALERGKPERALKVLDGRIDALRRDGQRAQAHAVVCRAHYELGDFESALEACDAAVKLGSDARSWSYLNNRGVMHLLLGRLEDAKADFEAAAASNPAAWSVRRNLALISEQQERNYVATVSSDR
jgi:Flp pilus assembly protein TadD